MKQSALRGGGLLAGGALYALGFPSFDVAACAWLALVPLILLARDRPPARAAAYGMLAGVAAAWATGPWFAQAIGRYFGTQPAAGVVGACLYAVVVWGLSFAAFAGGVASIHRSGCERRSFPFAVAALWVAVELFRGRVLGQPWGLLAYTQHAQLGLIQVAALVGPYGVSFLLALGNAALADATTVLQSGGGCRAAGRVLALPAAVVAACWVVGDATVWFGAAGDLGGRTVAVVQTNVEPAFHWTRSYTQSEIMAHVAATEEVEGHPALVVWPENSVPRYLEAEPALAVRLGDLARRRHADLLFGGPRWDGQRVYNSARLITADGRNGGYYDKQHLVLLAEDKPLSRFAADGPDEDPREFAPGTRPGLLNSFVTIGVSICHEIVFPELVHRTVGAGAELLVNISNDGWLDGGWHSASRQHFAMAAFRAVEARRYVVRAATTGVSGVIDPYGRVLRSLEPGESGILTVGVAGRRGLTPYVRFGDVFASACLGLTLLAAVGQRRRRLALNPGLSPSPSRL